MLVMLHRKGGLLAGIADLKGRKLLGDPEQIAKLADTIRKGNVAERRAAVITLKDMIGSGAITPEQAIGTLREAVRNKDKQVRLSALLTLSELGTEGLPGLGEGLLDDEVGVRNFSAALIQQVLKNGSSVSLNMDFPIEHLIDNLLGSLSIAGTDSFAASALSAMAGRMPVALLERIEAFRGTEAATSGDVPHRLILVEDAARHTLSAMAGKDRC
jgi:HEAT repeat protein